MKQRETESLVLPSSSIKNKFIVEIITPKFPKNVVKKKTSTRDKIWEDVCMQRPVPQRRKAKMGKLSTGCPKSIVNETHFKQCARGRNTIKILIFQQILRHDKLK
jgi:hypothetical protein